MRYLRKLNIFRTFLFAGLLVLVLSISAWQTPRASDDEVGTSPRASLLRQADMELVDLGLNKLVHLDLKGAPPKLSYLAELLPVLKQWGATGLLVEYEDTFPYWGAQLSVLGSAGPDSPGVYSRQEVEEFLHLASQLDLEVVPLIQTFGHFEFVLKHDVFRGLREVENFPSSLCPSHQDSLPLVQAMVSQLLQLHPNIKTLHIGADEVWHMGLCEACRLRMSQMSDSSSARDRLFLEHVTGVLRWLRSDYPALQLVMWDDMLRHMDPLLLQEYELGHLVEPMVWHYRPAKSFSLPPDLWAKYAAVFAGVWVATAYKGASGSNALLPWIAQHLDCQQHWLQLLQAQHERGALPSIRGVALTGWSRYDHYAVTCELLPVSLPSLALCLAQLQTRTFSSQLHANVSRSLGYPEGQLVSLQPQPQAHEAQHELQFPGWKSRLGVEWLMNVQSNLKSVLESEQCDTWLNPYLTHLRFSNPARVVPLRRKLRRMLDELASVERFLRPVLESMLPGLAVEEWFGTNVEPARDKLRGLLLEAQRQVALGGRTRGYHLPT